MQWPSHWLQTGCPMGSILGPLLWNIGYDVILQQLEERGTRFCCYADDTLLIVGADTVGELRSRVQEEVAEVSSAKLGIGLNLNIQKTAVLVFDGRPKYSVCTRLTAAYGPPED